MYALAHQTLIWSAQAAENAVSVTIAPDHVYFLHHGVKEWRVLPGVVFIELMLTGYRHIAPNQALNTVSDMVWLRPIMHRGDVSTQVDLQFSPIQDRQGRTLVECQLLIDGTVYAVAALSETSNPNQLSPAVPLNVRERISESTTDHLTRAQIYSEFGHMNIHYGPTFRRISYVQRKDNLALAWLTNNDGVALDWANLLDCAFQTGMAISIGTKQHSLMPYSLGQLILHPAFMLEQLGSAYVLTEKHSEFRTSLTIFDDCYQPMISVRDLGVKSANF